MDVENTADRIVRIDVSKSRVDVHVRLDGTDHDRRARPQATDRTVAVRHDRRNPAGRCSALNAMSDGIEEATVSASIRCLA